MNRDEILKRLKDLGIQKHQQESLCEQSKANANAISGAIQELTSWLKKLELKEKEEADKAAAEKAAAEEKESQQDAA